MYKLGKIEIKDDNFLGVDLSVEKKYLEGLMDSLGENMKDCAVSYYLSRRCFGICCEKYSCYFLPIFGKKFFDEWFSKNLLVCQLFNEK